MNENKEKLEFDDMIANNMIASMILTVGNVHGQIFALHYSVNFDKLSDHKKREILDIEHHTHATLSHLVQYFEIREEQGK